MDVVAHAAAFRAAYLGPTENVYVRPRVDSTNEVARRLVSAFLAEDETPPRLLILALEQTRGRGRRGRPWSSPRGDGLYASLVLPQVSHELLVTLPMRAAVGLARGVERLAAQRCTIKWPNDLLLDGAKVGGILIETVARGEDPPVVVLGAGVNVGVPPGDVGDRAVTSLRQANAAVGPLAEASAVLVAALEEALDGAAPVAEYTARSAHRAGDVLVCRLGEAILHGEFLGFDANGFLRLRGPAGERVLSAAEVIEG